MCPDLLDRSALDGALHLRDLTDPSQGQHAMQLIADVVTQALVQRWGCSLRIERGPRIVSVADNYDLLRYPAQAVTRAARYSRYVSDSQLLRTHTSAMIPPALRRLATSPEEDVLLACPGITYRRDVIDRLHTGEPHQMDLWRIRTGEPRLTRPALLEMIEAVVRAALPGRVLRVLETEHPYTEGGLQIDVVGPAGDWVEVGECGLAHPEVLASCGLDPTHVSGLAMGVGLDRLLMLRKGVDDVRLLRAEDPRIAGQMLDLSEYRPMSRMPPITRDMSIAVAEETDEETLGDRVRTALGERAGTVEEVAILQTTPYAAMPPAALRRIGMRPGQKNVLVRIVLRDPARTLTSDEANRIRDNVYSSLHEGAVGQWAAARSSP